MQAIFFVAFLVIGIAQVSAGMEGLHLYFGVGSFVSFVLFVISYAVPIIGSLLAGASVYYGAHHGWRWEWWQALALAAPGIVFWVVVMATGGIAALFESRK
jgi:hypothetical protein